MELTDNCVANFDLENFSDIIYVVERNGRHVQASSRLVWTSSNFFIPDPDKENFFKLGNIDWKLCAPFTREVIAKSDIYNLNIKVFSEITNCRSVVNICGYIVLMFYISRDKLKISEVYIIPEHEFEHFSKTGQYGWISPDKMCISGIKNLFEKLNLRQSVGSMTKGAR